MKVLIIIVEDKRTTKRKNVDEKQKKAKIGEDGEPGEEFIYFYLFNFNIFNDLICSGKEASSDGGAAGNWGANDPFIEDSQRSRRLGMESIYE